MAKELVNHPDHYTWIKGELGVEVLDILEVVCEVSGWNVGQALKYAFRCDHKHPEDLGITDLRKAVFYLQREIARREARLADRGGTGKPHGK